MFAGMAAYAGSFDIAYVPNTGVNLEGNVLTMEPGQTARLFVSVSNMDCMVDGFQVQYAVRDAAGNANALDGNVILKPLSASNSNVFVPLGMSKLVGDGFGQSQPIDGGDQVYRIIAANTTYGVFWIGSEEDALAFFNVPADELYGDPDEGGLGATASMFEQGNVFRFDIQTSADWNEEFATLDFDDAYGIFQFKGEGQYKIAEGSLDLTIRNANYTPSEPQDLTGEIVVSEPTEDGLVTVSYNGPEDVTITVNGEEYTEPIQLVDGENVLNVVVSAEGYNNLEESFTINWTAPVVPPEPVDLQGEIVVGEPNEEGVVTIEYTGNENVTVTVTINGEPAEEPYQLVDGVNTIVVTVEGEGYNPMTETFEVEWNAPEPPDDPHMVGKWIVLIDNAGEEHWYELNADPNGENNWSMMLTLHHNPWAENVPFYFMVDGVQMGAETDMYEPAMGDNTQTVLNPVFEGENMFYVPATYTYTFGLQLKDGQYYLLVAQGPQTAVNEINGGKAVAGVRYFNMAGQEMQEANGMTIVVTTYTDGTTSAVKVMK